jgi:hypothetical protein
MGLIESKMAELPKDEPTVSSAFLLEDTTKKKNDKSKFYYDWKGGVQ